ncbi:MAG: hypothetical protein GY724_15785 [Actinomycetia bacterium]|nr:hypothetical protein [Actinomycetes bacterium]
MAKRERRFAVALRGIDRRALNNAFDFCNHQNDLESYDRTALGRWLEGSIPSRRDFVRRMADHLDEPTIFQAWVEEQEDSSSTDVKAVVTRYRGLTPHDKREAFQQIRDDLIMSPTRIRSDFSMRVELHDSDDPEVYRLALAINWVGHLPPKAKTAIVTDYDDLAAAFDQEDCVFRDVVELDEQLFKRALFHEDASRHNLSYTPVDGDSRSVTVVAEAADQGVYEFPNDEVERARIRLRVAYPFPRGIGVYPIVFKGYQVAGPAVITLAIHSRQAQTPRGYAFLGSGRSWEASKPDDRELEIVAGTHGAILGADTGIMLHWSESTI